MRLRPEQSAPGHGGSREALESLRHSVTPHHGCSWVADTAIGLVHSSLSLVLWARHALGLFLSQPAASLQLSFFPGLKGLP